MSTGNGTSFTVYGLGGKSTLANDRSCSFSTSKMKDWFVSGFNLKSKLQGDCIFETLFFAPLSHLLQWYLKALLLLYFFCLSIEDVSVHQSFLLNTCTLGILFSKWNVREFACTEIYILFLIARWVNLTRKVFVKKIIIICAQDMGNQN